jgi:FG-GAP repeat protein
MNDGKEFLLLAFLCVGAAGLTATPAFAQRPRAMGGPPEAPKAITKTTGEWQAKSIAYVKASNTSADLQFGSAIALSGDGNTLAVGAASEDGGAKGINGNQADQSAVNAGAVYVYTRTASGWKQQAYLKASNTHKGYQFGNAVSLNDDGNTLAVGSTGEASSDTGVNGDQTDTSMDEAGAVYVFTRNGSTWSQQAYVKASNTGTPDVGNQFGYSVALSGDGNNLAVGSTSEPSAATGVNGDQKNASAPDSGAAYVFTRTGSRWTQQAYVKPWNTTVRGQLFGYSIGLSTDGSTMAVGAFDEQGGRGALYIFTRAAGNWSQQTRLQGSNEEAQDSIGCALAISGDGNTVVGGAFDEDAILSGVIGPHDGENDQASDVSAGTAYVFVRKDGHWSQQAILKAFNTRINDQFGWALAMSRDGNTIAVGSHLEDSGAKGINGDQAGFSAEDSGAVYVYRRTGNEWEYENGVRSLWRPAAYVKASNPQPAAEFGIAVALSADGKVLAVGAFKEKSGAKGVNGNQADSSVENAGAAYVYY